ncbi:hypothetical protein BDV93DRAFT_457079 [Ceratobasidium sp. AG-I]|nr:hypothetical protein BDV93DRAFT_457079 [Ceratobasidium sp. AG-I]
MKVKDEGWIDPLKVLTPSDKGSLFGSEEGDEESEAGTAKGNNARDVHPETAEVKEETKSDSGFAKIESPVVDHPASHRSSTGGVWDVLTSFPGRALPFWGSSVPSAVPVHRIPEVDPVTIPTPISPKAVSIPAPIPDESIFAPEITFHCDICQDNEPEVDVAIIDGCGHQFGRDCLNGFISSRLTDGRFPIVCPTCATGEGDGKAGVISSWLAESVGMTEKEYERWTQLELAAYSFMLECTQCERSYMVSRDDYNDPSTKEFRCAMPDCDHTWCKSCSTTIEKGQTHTCDGSAELTRLMEKEGWKTCPGCQTPIEKNEGCNHISCTTPACNTHFCYVCGGKVVQSVIRSEINEAVMEHFSNCKLFDVPDEV